MGVRNRIIAGAALAVLAAFLASPALAQIEEQVSVYTGENAEGYIGPLSGAIGTTLNTGFFRSAYLPTSGFNVGIEVLVMGLYFGEDEKTFDATTEGSFRPQSTVTVPTVVGEGKAVEIPGESGTNYIFPGGLSLNSFGMLAPQLRISSLRGTELVGRYGKVSSGDDEIGDITLYGVGLRHNVSQYLGENFSIDMAIGGIYQKFNAGENKQGNNLMESEALSVGIHASKRFPVGFSTLEPYTALSYDTFQLSLDYESDSGGQTQIDLDRTESAHWTIGLNFNLKYANVFAEYNVAASNSFGFGLALGVLGY
jgi:hypothetical protein